MKDYHIGIILSALADKIGALEYQIEQSREPQQSDADNKAMLDNIKLVLDQLEAPVADSDGNDLPIGRRVLWLANSYAAQRSRLNALEAEIESISDSVVIDFTDNNGQTQKVKLGAFVAAAREWANILREQGVNPDELIREPEERDNRGDAGERPSVY